MPDTNPNLITASNPNVPASSSVNNPPIQQLVASQGGSSVVPQQNIAPVISVAPSVNIPQAVPIDSVQPVPPTQPQVVQPAVTQPVPQPAPVPPVATPIVPVQPLSVTAQPSPTAPSQLPVTPEPVVPVASEAARISVKQRLAGALGKFKFGRTKNIAPIESAPSLVLDQSVINQGRSKFVTRIYVLLVIILLSSVLIFLTEFGLISIGLERVYGLTGIEKIWGGLPRDSESAVIQSFVNFTGHEQFAVSGSVSVSIDKTAQNPVTLPLVSANDSILALATAPVRIILAEETEEPLPDVDDPSIIWEEEDPAVDETPSSPSSSTSSSPSTSTTNSGSTSNSSSTSDLNSASLTEDITDTSISESPSSSQSDSDSPLFVDTETTKVVNGTIKANFGESGNTAEVRINKPIGSSSIYLKNSGQKLWVKSEMVKFSDKAKAGKWLLYNLVAMKEKSVLSPFQSIDTSDFTIEGRRAGNETIDSVRCYKYELKNVELGNSLSAIGIEGKNIQNVSGTAWIGIKDKLVRRLDLKVATVSPAPITNLSLSLSISDYDNGDNFTIPTVGDTIEANLAE